MQAPPNTLRVLLATQRPAVEAFFSRSAALVVDRIDVSAEEISHVETASVAVVDVALDRVAGAAFCHELLELRPDLPVAALVCCPYALTPVDLRGLLGDGVAGLLDLQSSDAELARALATIARGGSVLHLHVGRGDQALLRELLAEGEPRAEVDLRLLALLALGLPDHEIGRRLHLSPHTVKHHIEHLRWELGARNRIELAAWAGRHGFYAPDAAALAPLS